MRARSGLLASLYMGLGGLGLLATCSSVRASVTSASIDIGRHRLQSPSLQGTGLPAAIPEWLRGQGLVASLGDGLVIEIRHFGGDTIEVLVRDSGEIRNLAATELVGMTWREMRCENSGDGICTELAFRISKVVPDLWASKLPEEGPENQQEGNPWLYLVEYASTGDTPGEWAPVCGSAGDDSASDSVLGVFVDGLWGSDGSWRRDGYTFSCRAGAIAKCVRDWGYQPWRTWESPDQGPVDLQRLHVACTRAARAEYCGDGVSYTKEGVLIDLFDIHGYNLPEPVAGFVEESTWDEHGAITLHHARVPELFPGSCPAQARSGHEAAADQRSPVIRVWSVP